MNPETLLAFNQTFKNLQIHAGLGVTEENAYKVQSICRMLLRYSQELVEQAYPEDFETVDDLNEETIEDVEIELKPAEKPLTPQIKPHKPEKIDIKATHEQVQKQYPKIMAALKKSEDSE